MKVEILRHTEKPLSVIGANASYCYDTKLKDEGHARRIAEHCLRSGHMRNEEFPDITVKLSEVSARFGREWYTHVGGNPTRVQASTRFIDYAEFEYFTPMGMTKEQEKVFHETMKDIQKGYGKLQELGCKNDVTGYVLPLGMDTTIVCKINARTLENMFNQRLCLRALREYRQVMHMLLAEIKNLDEEWAFIADNYFKVKCEKLGYCPEDYSCDRVKQGTTLSKEEFKQAIKEAEGKKLDKRMSGGK